MRDQSNGDFLVEMEVKNLRKSKRRIQGFVRVRERWEWEAETPRLAMVSHALSFSLVENK